MSFKRKTTSTASTPSTPLLSTGLPSLDDILGGGFPLSCSLVFTAPDVHSAYAELVQRYFVAQGVAAGQRVCFVGNDARAWVGECMWLSAGAEEDVETRTGSDEKITIAWRYEQMKPFQTTVAASKAATADACRTFDLTTRIPPNVVAEARIVEVAVDAAPGSTTRVLERLGEMLADAQGGPIRICIPALGSPGWGDLNAQDILRFLHGLRALLRRHPHGCASVSLPPEWSGDSVAAGWHEKLGWVADGAITMAAFTANPALAATFPGHHGLLRIHTLPAPTTLVPASDRFSTLRGTGSGGENNLGFKCTRKRLVFETVHLDVEGGVGERRTSAPPTTTVAVQAIAPRPPMAAVDVEIEGVPGEPEPVPVPAPVKKKSTKRVGFQSDVYDF